MDEWSLRSVTTALASRLSNSLFCFGFCLFVYRRSISIVGDAIRGNISHPRSPARLQTQPFSRRYLSPHPLILRLPFFACTTKTKTSRACLRSDPCRSHQGGQGDVLEPLRAYEEACRGGGGRPSARHEVSLHRFCSSTMGDTAPFGTVTVLCQVVVWRSIL